MKAKTTLRESLQARSESELLFLTEPYFDHAIVGIHKGERVVYSIPKLIECLMKFDGFSHEEAIEYFDYNIESAYMGLNTPLYIDPHPEYQIPLPDPDFS